MDNRDLVDETVRLPYFFKHGPNQAVLCPACADSAPEPEKLVAVYTASRLYRCGACLIAIGPVSEEEEAAG